ncbi:hypothetical protein [Nocardia miyunensis]|uniref:hypothetical protein n=1 Tax=Nocardia miyunensis TaxID=282684 RepID=UPI00082E0734|nr:hypothetical protein [Nocardia miyunensis]
MHFNLTLPPNTHLPVYSEIMQTIGHGLRDLGHTVVDRRGFDADRINLLFAYFAQPQAFPGRSILYQLEPVCDWRKDNGHLPLAMLRSNVVWDYSRYNIEQLRHHGIEAHYVPVGYHPALRRVPRVAEEDIDVLFYGFRTPRRMGILSALRRAGLKVEYREDTFGRRLDPIIARAKVVLSMHGRSDYHPLESVRVGYLMSNSKAVVAEVNHKDDDDELGEGIAGVRFPRLVDTCVDLVRDDDARIELAAKGFATISRRSITDVLERVMYTAEPLDPFAGAWGPRG